MATISAGSLSPSKVRPAKTTAQKVCATVSGTPTTAAACRTRSRSHHNVLRCRGAIVVWRRMFWKRSVCVTTVSFHYTTRVCPMRLPIRLRDVARAVAGATTSCFVALALLVVSTQAQEKGAADAARASAVEPGTPSSVIGSVDFDIRCDVRKHVNFKENCHGQSSQRND